ncbi:hypothetical protein [Eisenbergiella massiliensis]|uniref:hypothetical protein n=2 Tax=Lachnospiraceae TaxID=186803 RepID=UPI0023F25C76|nr:hypothetical protein [Eisenbergiella massiliensis]
MLLKRSGVLSAENNWGAMAVKGQKQNNRPDYQLQYRLDKMHDNDYYVLIRFRDPDYIFINALSLAILERME